MSDETRAGSVLDPRRAAPSTVALRAAVERPREQWHWGHRVEVVPRLVEEVFGDGRKLIWIGPLEYLPNRYVVRIDSAWSFRLGDEFDAHYDDVIAAIEEEFGSSARCTCDGRDRAPDPEAHDPDCWRRERTFPRFPSNCVGTVWGDESWDSYLGALG